MRRQKLRFTNEGSFRWALQKYEPGGYGTFVESIKQGFIETPVMQAVERGIYELSGYTSPSITEDQFNEITKNVDVQYEEGMTYAQADMLNKVHMRDNAYHWFTQNVGMWEPSRIGGFLVGGVTDPSMLLPFGGLVTRMAATSKLFSSGIQANFTSRMGRHLGDIAKTAGTAGGYAIAAEGVIWPKKNRMQQPWGITNALTDVAFAVGAGATFGAFAKVGSALVKLPEAWRAGALTKASQDLADGEFASPGIHPDPTNPARTAGERNPEYNETSGSWAEGQAHDFNSAANRLRQEVDSILETDTARTFAGEVKGVVPEIVQGVREKFGLAWESWGKGDFHKFISNVRDCVLRGRI